MSCSQSIQVAVTKIPQTEWLKPTHISFSGDYESKIKCPADLVCSESPLSGFMDNCLVVSSHGGRGRRFSGAA